jgi:hypothetical protein
MYLWDAHSLPQKLAEVAGLGWGGKGCHGDECRDCHELGGGLQIGSRRFHL